MMMPQPGGMPAPNAGAMDPIALKRQQLALSMAGGMRPQMQPGAMDPRSLPGPMMPQPMRVPMPGAMQSGAVDPRMVPPQPGRPGMGGKMMPAPAPMAPQGPARMAGVRQRGR